MAHIIGQLAKAEEDMAASRFAMRAAKGAKDKAQYKRDFRKARNRALNAKEGIMGRSIR